MADIHYIEVDDIAHVRELISYSLIKPATVCYARDGSLIYVSSDNEVIAMAGDYKSSLKFASSKAEMLKLADITRGQTVFRTDEERVFILIGDNPSEESSWTTEKLTPLQWGHIKEVINNG